MFLQVETESVSTRCTQSRKATCPLKSCAANYDVPRLSFSLYICASMSQYGEVSRSSVFGQSLHGFRREA
jgi:hypothetical protein